MKVRSTLSPKIFLLSLLRTRFLLLYVVLLLLVFFSSIGKYWIKSSSVSSLPQRVLPASCDGRRIYIYELSPEFNFHFVHNCSNFKKNVDLCPYMENGGMGRIFSYEEQFFPHGVWHNTWQFSLELYFYERLKRYPCLTTNEEAANVFYVPFYAGMDLTNHMSHPSITKARANVYMELLDWLRQQYYFLRNGGFDHFITLGRIAGDFRRSKDESFGSQMLIQPDFQHMVKLVPERDGNTPVHTGNEIAIPYPSYYHPRLSSDLEALLRWSQLSAQRSVLVSIASVRRRQGSGGIREKLMADCEDDARCTVLVCTGNEGVNQSDLSTRAYSYLPIAGHSLQESCNFPSIVLDVFHRSVFCLQPPGDSPTRRSFIDSLIAGCIPVIFKKSSAWSQYTAFLPEHGDDYSVLIPVSEVRTHNVVHLLAAIPRTKVDFMRAKIKQLLPRILYSDVNRTYSGRVASDGNSYDRPDAFDIALDETLSLARKNLATLTSTGQY